MNRVLTVFLVCFSFLHINSQDFNGKELLEKAISYHDPYSNGACLMLILLLIWNHRIAQKKKVK